MTLPTSRLTTEALRRRVRTSPAPSKLQHWARTIEGNAPLVFVVLVAISHALPALLDAKSLHSDAAVVGLQALHLLRGEWSWFLWGSGYQTSADSAIAAAFFAIFGPTPLALTLSTFVSYLGLVALAFGVVRRRFAPWPSALLVMPLAMVTGPLHTYMFSPPRQASLTLIFAAIWLIDGAASGKRAVLGCAAGAMLAGLACFCDPYALLFLPALALFLALTVFEVPAALRVAAGTAGAAGAVTGLIPFWLLSHSARASPGVLRLKAELLTHNFTLLWRVCLPYLLGATAYFSPHAPLVEPWPAPRWFHAVQLLGATILLLGMALGGARAVLSRRHTHAVRRLAVLGSLMLPITLGAFMVSVMVMDRLSARYLVAIVLMTPFAFAPLLAWLGSTRFALLIAPCLVSAAVSGWLGYGDAVDGPRIVKHDQSTSDEAKLEQCLREQQLGFALADYWVSYRLTFLFAERVIIVPWHATLDRYPPYRAAVAAEQRVGYIYDPWRSKEALDTRLAQIERGETEYSRTFERLSAGRYTVLVLRRAREPRLGSRARL